MNKHSDISAMTTISTKAQPSFKPAPPPKPPKPGRATGEAFMANKSYFNKGFEPKTAFLNTVLGSPITRAAARGVIGLGAKEGAPMAAHAANLGVRAGMVAAPLMSHGNGPQLAGMGPKTAELLEKVVSTVLSYSKDQKKVASEYLTATAAEQIGRSLFHSLLKSNLIRIT
jgi:hypothetical protein